MQKISSKRAIFAACARDCASYLSKVLANVSQMAELFAETAYVFIENDSHDNTPRQLNDWCEGRAAAHLISLDGLSNFCSQRTVRLSTARNRYLSLVRSGYSTYDYLFVLDCNEVNTTRIDLDAIRRSIEFLERDVTRAGVFANSEGDYYDLWALRHPTLCPNDIWEEVCDYVTAHRVTDEEAFIKIFKKRIFQLPSTAPPLEVNSAFGGLGIYKVASILGNERNYVGYKNKLINLPTSSVEAVVGWQCCEHVSFNAGFRERGEKLFIMPELVNSQYLFALSDCRKVSSFWRSLLFDAVKIGRNQTCPCGSGKKYKHCHGRHEPAQ
jgi:hypothetical protein